MNYSILEEARELAEWSQESEAFSISQELKKVEDKRGKKGKRYQLALLLTCILLAKIASGIQRHRRQSRHPALSALFSF